MHIEWKHPVTIIYGILVGGGFLFGVIAWLFLPDFIVEQLRQYTMEQLQLLSESVGITDGIVAVFRTNIIDLMRVYLCGICLLGLPILILFLFLKCFSIGFVSCMLLQHSFFLFLTRILYIPVLLFAVALSCRFSLRMVQNQMDHPVRQLLQYTLLFVGIALCVLLISVLDGCSSYFYLQGIY